MDMDDDDFFDEELLRTVDEAERKYNDELARKREADKPPPAKRPRLDAPAKPLTRQASIRATYVPPNDDDDPEIVLDDQGNYSFGPSWQPPPKTVTSDASRASTLDVPGPATSAHAAQQHARYQTQMRHASSATSSRQSTPTLQPSSIQPRLPSSRVPPSVGLREKPPDLPRESPGRARLESQISEMQLQLAKLQQSNAELSSSLQEAQEIKWTREGEVANLRRVMEQKNAHHVAEIKKLKEERQEAEAARNEREKVLKEDMERMKTRFLIRQQELETSTRKRTWSASRRRPGSSQLPLVSQTPVPSHSRNTQGWTLHDTPAPTSRKREDKRLAPHPPPTFDGFVNSFNSSSPVRSPVKVRKFKSTILATESQGERSSSPPAPSFNDVFTSTKQPTQTPHHHHQYIDVDSSKYLSSPTDGPAADLDLEIPPMDDQEELDFRFGVPVVDLDEVHNVIMHHRRNGIASLLSLQVLLAANSSREYCQACSMLVQRGHLGDAIVTMAAILSTADPFPRDALATLLDLTTYLLFSFPPLTDAVLSIRDSDSNESLPQMLNIILSVAKPLIADVVAFLECLGWNLMDHHMQFIAELLRQPDFIGLLLDDGGLAAVRVLGVFASHQSLHQALLYRPRERQDHLIEKLSAIVSGTAEGEVQVAALTCIGQLALAHDDARAVLLDSHVLMPVLVRRVWGLVGEFWDGESAESSTLIRVLQSAVHVMHHLALSRGATNELRDRLHVGSGGLDYMFAVAIGRLAYADPPARFSQVIRDELHKLTEFSRDLLELVVDGPEMDDIYNAYQWDDAEPAGDSGDTNFTGVTEDSLMEDDFVA